MDGMVEVTPEALRFRFQLNKQLLGIITLNNASESRVAFKIKTTAPRKYVVRPSSGIADAKSQTQVQVIMQAQKDYPADFANCKDKFMVQTVALGETEVIDKDTFNKDVKRDALKEARLRVVLEGPAAPPSPVLEDDPIPDAATEMRMKAALNDYAATSQENSYLKGKLDKISQECESLRRQLDRAQLAGSGKTASQGQGKFVPSLIHIILVAILAFLVGHYIH